MKFKAYHKIKQFKDCVRAVNSRADFKGLDVDNNPIYELSNRPTVEVTGTVKLHGTNAGISYTNKEGIRGLKRGSLLSVDHTGGHFGFNQFLADNKGELTELMESISKDHMLEDHQQINLYGEWAGTGIQKGVGISLKEKSFYMFDCSITNVEEKKWINIKGLQSGIDRVYNIYDFPTYSITIDFNHPGKSQNKLIQLTNEVEKDCPVTKQLGYSGIGEGIVWTFHWKGEKFIFKVKGTKHSTSKVKTLASVDPEELNSIEAFVSYACTPNRINQGIVEVDATEKRDIGNLLRWVANDIISEESEELVANNLTWKKVAKKVTHFTRVYYFTQLEKV